MGFPRKKIVCVEWEDAESSNEYIDPRKPVNKKLTLVRTVGYLVAKERDKVTLVSECFDDNWTRFAHYIPRKLIKNIRELN